MKVKRSKRRQLLSAGLTVLFAGCSVFSAASLSQEALDAKYIDTRQHLQTIVPQVGSIGGEWLVLGLARSDAFGTNERAAYYQRAVDYVQAVGSDRLHRHKSSDNSRLILALSAIGKDARSTGGFDLTAPLNDLSYVTRQGINGVFWALIALDSCDYPCEVGVREQLLSAVLTAQHHDGGWGLDETGSDPDMTGMAIQALAPYRYYDAAVSSAIDRAVAWLISMQNTEGGFVTYDGLTPESCAQVIVALSALGMDAQHDSRFCINGKTVWDSMMTFAVDGGFSHTVGMDYNQMATEQAFYAMTAYFRMLSGKTALYNMTDKRSYAVPDADGDGTCTINDATTLQRYIAEYIVCLTIPQQRLCDLSGNGKTDINDVTMLQRLLAQ